MYAKLIEGELQYAPKHITIGTNNIWNASAELMLTQGWKLVVFTEPPEAPTGYYYESAWEEDEAEIVQTWTLEKLPDDIDDAEAYQIIFGGE